MAISNGSKRIQLTLNEDKEKERVVLDYLASSFNETQEIKRILFQYIVNQIDTKEAKVINSKDELIKDADSNSKSLKNDISESKIIKDNESNDKLLTYSNIDTKIIEDSINNEITIDLSTLSDEPMEIKSNIGAENQNKSEKIKQKKLKALQQFM